VVEVFVIVRGVGRLKPDYSLKFELPEVPAIGSYISINRPDVMVPLGEDLIVKQVWWRLFHPVTGAHADDKEEDRAGSLIEIMVECDIAIGPYASESWRKSYEGRPGVVEFEVERAYRPSLPD
jgi:hypothetical protein